MPDLSWPPTPEQYYRDAPASRPVFQGDVFDDVPVVKAKSAGNVAKDPNIVIERRMVASLGFPCDIYDAGRLMKVQTVGVVVDAAKAGIPAAWNGAFTFAPLPDLLGDGRMFAVDLRTAANIDASYLRTDRRIRSLSELGWASFRQRMALCDTRAMISFNSLLNIGAATWAELELWERWCEAGRDQAAFQQWLNHSEATLGGFLRRDMLERGQQDAVRAALERDLYAK